MLNRPAHAKCIAGNTAEFQQDLEIQIYLGNRAIG